MRYTPGLETFNIKKDTLPPELDKYQVAYFLERGATRCLEQLYSSWIGGIHFQRVKKLFSQTDLLLNITGKYVDEPYAIATACHAVTQFHEEPHKIRHVQWEQFTRRAGSYLRIILGYTEGGDPDVARRQLLAVTETIRAVFVDTSLGVLDHELSWQIDPISRKTGYTYQSSIHVDPKDFGYLEQHHQTDDLTAGLALTFEPEAASFLSLAYQQTTIERKFLLTWIALEKQVGNGNARKKLYKEHFGSAALSDEVYRLHDVRGDMVHKQDAIGGHGVGVQSRDIQLLRMAIRLAACADPEQQKMLLETCEKMISDATASQQPPPTT